MKTAIIITGQMRSFEKCIPNLHWMLFRHFPGADFYVSTVADANASKANLLKLRYPEARVEIEAVAEQPDCVADMRAKGVNLPTERRVGHPYTHEPYAISVPPQAVLRQLWQLERGWELLRGREASKYEVVIRCRPDLWFHSFTVPDFAKASAFVDGPWIATPWWGAFGGVNDRFAIMRWEAAADYFTTYSQIPKLAAEGCPIHPESLVAAASGASSDLLAEFSTLRENGEMRPPEISSVDLARLSATLRA